MHSMLYWRWGQRATGDALVATLEVGLQAAADALLATLEMGLSVL